MPGRARFPACSPLGTVEPPILEFANARLLESDKPWSAQRMPLVMDRVRNRLGQLSPRLGEADWLDGAFSAGDLMMVSVLQAESVGFAGRISEPLRRCDLRWPAAKHGPPTSGGPLMRNWRFSLARNRPVRRSKEIANSVLAVDGGLRIAALARASAWAVLLYGMLTQAFNVFEVLVPLRLSGRDGLLLHANEHCR